MLSFLQFSAASILDFEQAKLKSLQKYLSGTRFNEFLQHSIEPLV